jgi:ribonuclease P protein component
MERLRQRADFLAAAAGARVAVPAFVVQVRDRRDPGPVRVGLTVSRKVGTAVERNRVRRRLRELVKRNGPPFMRPHCDYVLVGRRAALGRSFETMLDDLKSALKRLDAQMSKRAQASAG